MYVSIPSSYCDLVATAPIDQQDLTVSGLNGDADGDYEISANIIYSGAVNASTYFVMTCGLASYQGAHFTAVGSTGTAMDTSAANTSWLVAQGNGGSDLQIIFRATLVSKTGRYRQCWYQGRTCNTNNQIPWLSGEGYSVDTTTNITSITMHGPVAAAMRAGSILRVRKLGRTG